ncbi:MAG TPA: pyruvate formate-lyase-activating protein [Candidatus Udaeobacter sp.]|jgi:pyruvate formate lyase activating enzyme
MKLEAMEPTAPPIGSPFDLRLSASEKVDETDVRSALETGEWGFIHSFTTGSAVDGPGVRIVGWLSACQFRCVFCHNPDTWKLTNGTPVRLERAIEVVKQYRTSLRTMKGGLTISGGEPLMQHRFLSKLFPAIHEAGIHTALETNGYLGSRLTDDDLSSIDLVMLGLKAIEPTLHKRLTGMDNKPVHELARRLAARKHPVWIRFVIVPGWTDNMEEVDRMAEFAVSLGNVERVDVLPFHQMGRFKWDKLGMEYQMRDARPPSRETMDEAISHFRAAGLKAV